MKYILTFYFFSFSIFLYAQKTETYYTYNWKPCKPEIARFYSVLQKTDSGWLRYDYYINGPTLQMKALFEDSACKIFNGQCAFFYPNGQLSSLGREIHNKNEGVCVGYHSNGMMSDSANYHNGIPIGNRYKWHPNGIIADSINHTNDSMDVAIQWYDNGVVSQAGYYLHDKAHGKWQYFHRNGKPAGMETFNNGKLVTAEYLNEDGSKLADTSQSHAGASFKGGLSGWQHYLNNKLYWPGGYEFSNGNQAVVLIQLTINEDGNLENVEVAIPFHPVFDKIALDIIRNSPAWKPAISHNRKVKETFLQPVTFIQPEN